MPAALADTRVKITIEMADGSRVEFTSNRCDFTFNQPTIDVTSAGDPWRHEMPIWRPQFSLSGEMGSNHVYTPGYMPPEWAAPAAPPAPREELTTDQLRDELENVRPDSVVFNSEGGYRFEPSAN